MSIETLEKLIPLGEGGNLEQSKELIKLNQVDNIVEYVNPEIESPFNLKEGSKSDLGLFLSLAQKEGEQGYNVEKQKRHGRAGLIGRAIIQDKEGRKYRDIDGKGFGYLSDKHKFSFSGTPGILNYNAAQKELEVSEEMLKLDVRASRVLSIIRLKQLFDERGERISIGEAKEKGIIRKTDDPVVEVRLMGTNARIQDLFVDYNDYSQDKKRHDLLLKDARTIVSQEFGFDTEKFDEEKYMSWFAENLGKQIATMHKNGWVHTGLTDQNITLDGRLVDFATVEHFSEEKPEIEEFIKSVGYWQDIERAARSLKKFHDVILHYINRKVSDKEFWDNIITLKSLLEIFKETYLRNLNFSSSDEMQVRKLIAEQIKYGVDFD